jgi:beta-galactosidase
MLPALLLLLWASANAFAAEMPLDSGWLFLKADADHAEQVPFSDSDWRTLTLPHDWSIEGPFSETNLTGGAGGFVPAGVGWYRKHFSLPPDLPTQSISVEFDGVMANSDVWINGFHLGHRPNGYVGLHYPLTGHLNFPGDNVIAVRVDNSVEPASRFYAGAGIYGHVRLIATGPIHFEPNGIFITTPQISTRSATVNLEFAVTNESSEKSKVTLKTRIYSPDGKIAGTAKNSLATAPDASGKISSAIKVSKPRLWNLDAPNLYVAVSQIISDGKILDQRTNTFGIRQFKFDAATGFWLNGTHFKIKGVALHEDGGAFGLAVPASVWRSRLASLKTLGVNAIRTAHNPTSPVFLDLCDQMGFLVMDEFFDCWTTGKESLDRQRLADYHLYFNEWSQVDERDTIRRDRNHPAIILYSVGNEIHDTPNAAHAKSILAGLVAVAHAADPTRPVTMALFRPNVSHDYDDGLADMLDVVGQNYRENEILAAHTQKPARKIIGTENRHDRATWLALRDNPPYAGQFLWTGVDYLGESRRWPMVSHGSGLLDRTGTPRPVAFERQSWWDDRPMVFMTRRLAPTDAMPVDPGYAADERYSQVLFADWTPRNTQPHSENVEVYSNCKQVELFLNGQSLGNKELNADASPRNWTVPFAPGELKAIARDGAGNAVATNELRTAGPPAKIILTSERCSVSNDWNEVCEVTATITDTNEVTVPSANEPVSFSVSGPGEIAAVDNADNMSHESFQVSERAAFHGHCVAFVRATADSGQIQVSASAPGLAEDKIVIEAGSPP